MSEHRLPERDRPWVMRTYAGPLRRPALQRALPRATWPRARPASRSPSTCRPRPAMTPTTSSPAARSARSASRSPTRATCTAARRDPARRDEHLDDDQRDRRLAARPLRHRRRGERRRALRAQGHDPERHHQGVPLARHLRLPARALDAADRRHGRLHRQRGPEAGTRPTSAATTCRRPGRRRCRRSPTRSRPRSPCSTRSRRRGQVAEEDFPQGLRPHLLLRQRRHPLRSRSIAKLRAMGRALGGDRPRALRRHRREDAALPLRRPGQLASA